MLVGNFNNALSLRDNSSGKRIEETLDILHQMDLIAEYSTQTFYSAVYGSISKLDHNLGCKKQS